VPGAACRQQLTERGLQQQQQRHAAHLQEPQQGAGRESGPHQSHPVPPAPPRPAQSLALAVAGSRLRELDLDLNYIGEPPPPPRLPPLAGGLIQVGRGARPPSVPGGVRRSWGRAELQAAAAGDRGAALLVPALQACRTLALLRVSARLGRAVTKQLAELAEAN
jgi:hypothetical protein